MLGCRCLVNTEYENTLVGIEYRTEKTAEGKDACEVVVHFPLGYRLSPEDDDHGRRRDILLLISVLRRYSQKVDGTLPDHDDTGDIGFPIDAYLYIISDFVSNGYYREKEIIYKTARQGKISWSRTIKQTKPCVQGNNVFYLDFITRNQKKKDNEWITLIHKYCVYLSFLRMGWLFTGYVPPNPSIGGSDRLYKSVLIDKLAHTFNDRSRKLFKSMMAVLGYEEETSKKVDFRYGTSSFYHVWESMIDWVYGADNKERYYPKTKWRIGKKLYYKYPLEPDSIMPVGKDIYILDAKYYKYGITGKVDDLPDTSSIHKQITYGEFIDHNKKLRTGPDMKIYNAFILPYCTTNKIGMDFVGELGYIGEAYSEWKDNTETYERVEGVLLDTKMLMEMNMRQDMKKIQELADFIEKHYNKSREMDEYFRKQDQEEDG